MLVNCFCRLIIVKFYCSLRWTWDSTEIFKSNSCQNLKILLNLYKRLLQQSRDKQFFYFTVMNWSKNEFRKCNLPNTLTLRDPESCPDGFLRVSLYRPASPLSALVFVRSTWSSATFRLIRVSSSISLIPFIQTAVGLGNPLNGTWIWKFCPALTLMSFTLDMFRLGRAKK